MDLNIDPNTSLAELQTRLFMAAITELIQLARTTDQDHIKLRALTEVARLCNPAKRAVTQPTSEATESRRPSQAPLSPRPILSPRSGESSGVHPPSPSASSGAPGHASALEQTLDPVPRSE